MNNSFVTRMNAFLFSTVSSGATLSKHAPVLGCERGLSVPPSFIFSAPRTLLKLSDGTGVPEVLFLFASNFERPMNQSLVLESRLPLIPVGGCSVFVAFRLSRAPQTSESQPSPQTSQCDQTLWQYVYHPARLQVLDPCISVTGSVEEVRKEADGDIHILFRLDQQFESLLNEKNVSRQYGALVLEPTCQGNVRQADAEEPCSRYNGPYFEPQIGQRYLVSGTYVHGPDDGWNELHPVTSMQPVQ
jgi:hypothetical protein